MPAPEPEPDLDDPEYAAFAWGRYKRLMAWMALATIGVVVAALAWLHWRIGPLPIHLVIATSLGVGGSVLLAAALMGLMFLSSGSRHDERIDDHAPDRDKL